MFFTLAAFTDSDIISIGNIKRYKGVRMLLER